MIKPKTYYLRKTLNGQTIALFEQVAGEPAFSVSFVKRNHLSLDVLAKLDKGESVPCNRVGEPA